MFKFDLDIPTYAEWKVQVEKFVKEQPVKAQEYQKKTQQFWQDWFEDVLKPNLFNIFKKQMLNGESEEIFQATSPLNI